MRDQLKVWPLSVELRAGMVWPEASGCRRRQAAVGDRRGDVGADGARQRERAVDVDLARALVGEARARQRLRGALQGWP